MVEEIREQIMAKARETIDSSLSFYEDLLLKNRIFPVCIPRYLSVQETQIIRKEYEGKYPLFIVDSENFLDKEGSGWFTIFYFIRNS